MRKHKRHIETHGAAVASAAHHSGDLCEFLDSMLQGAIVTDGEGRVKAWNHAYLELNDLGRDQLRAGMSIDEVRALRIASGALPDHGLSFDALIEVRRKRWKAGIGFTDRIETGSGRILDIFRNRLENGDFVIYHVDVTDQVQHATEQSARVEMAEAALAGLPIGVAVIDSAGRFHLWNDAFLNFYGYRENDIYPGIPFDEFARRMPGYRRLPEAQRETVIAERKDFAVNPSRRYVLRQLSETLTLEITKHPLSADRQLLVFRDVTRDLRRQTEREAACQEAEAGRAELADIFLRLGHELRNPLNGMLGMASLLAHSGLSEDHAQRVEVLRDAGQMLLRLVEDLTDLGQLERQTLDLKPEPTDLDGLALGCVTLARETAVEKGLELAFDGSAEGLPKALIDPVRLRQVLMNLIGNAVKFTEKGSVVVSLSGAVEDRRLVVNLAVTDSGVGIPEAQCLSVFDEFKRLENDQAQPAPGLGLGLAIVKRLVDQMDGAIDIQSRLGKGTRITIALDLPLA